MSRPPHDQRSPGGDWSADADTEIVMLPGVGDGHPQDDLSHAPTTRLNPSEVLAQRRVAPAARPTTGPATGPAAGPVTGPADEASGPHSSGRHRAPSPLTQLTSAGRGLVEGLRSDPDQRIVAVLAVLVATLGLAPIALAPSEVVIYSGVATGTPMLYTYTIAIAAAVVVIGIQTRRQLARAFFPWLPFLGWMLLFAVLAWDSSPRTVSGLVHFSLVAIVFAIGVTAERADRRNSVLLWAFAAVAWLQLFAITMAVIGFPLRRIAGQQALDVLGRATGLTSHPGELAKLLFFCGMCALTLPQKTVRQRWVAWTTLGVVFLGVSLTQSRSVLAAVVSMILILVVLEFVTGRWQKKYFVVIGITGLLGLVSVPWLIKRFTADPEGGDRQHLLQVAFDVIREHPWAGVGPNSYVAIAGASDPLTASGVPVHNVLLLSAAELGIIGALLLWLPFAMTATTAIHSVFRVRTSELAPRVLVSALPGLVLIGMTGWGLMQGPYFLMLALIAGYFYARSRYVRVASGYGRD
ncbi:O-antigen ligase family protein [Micromonospora foliorum]|uniref:O-antigen ligase family protein n=1 Tax=Micromonospora foliorum TaxID=2911210 RepID=UPI001EE94A41|nr:O-antigen ligase family protein [Micromonospora foliorum]MCG5437337.1 O-antigen ligase family protein [Micromonospora foliorum]